MVVNDKHVEVSFVSTKQYFHTNHIIQISATIREDNGSVDFVNFRMDMKDLARALDNCYFRTRKRRNAIFSYLYQR